MPTHHSAARSGFTLLEVMIALAVGGIALSSIYAVGAASTRHFRQQQRISSTQTSLRSAMDQLKRDFQRAGFLATPNVQANAEACATVGAPLDDATNTAGTGRLAAVSSFSKNVNPRPTDLDPGNLNGWATMDTVTVMGNYATSGEYPGISVAPGGLVVTVPMNWQSFQRDFAVWTGLNAGQCNTAAFAAAFAVGRMVRIHTQTERNFYSTVASVTCSGAVAATVTLNTPIPSQCNADAGWISPVNTLRYQAVNATGDDAARSTTNRNVVLRRTEVMPDNKANPLLQVGGNVPIDDRNILDYVVRFNVDFMMSNGSPNSVNLAPAAAGDVLLRPEQVRGVIIDLAARTAEHEPEFRTIIPFLAFQVLSTPGAARVRQLHAELLLPNVAYRGF
jgi:prepilin-type N-terminal cleavage/methylation domain-containing protein